MGGAGVGDAVGKGVGAMNPVGEGVAASPQAAARIATNTPRSSQAGLPVENSDLSTTGDGPFDPKPVDAFHDDKFEPVHVSQEVQGNMVQLRLFL